MEGIVAYLLALDIAVTDYFSSMAIDHSQWGVFIRLIAKTMEMTMHGVPWLAGLLVGIFLTDNSVAIHFLVNLLFALLFDLLVVGTLKAIFRRARPRGNPGHMIAEAPYVDQFSFPSGHTTRATMLTKLLITLAVMELKTKILVCCFPVALGLSRVVLGRHHFSDVLAGLLIGVVECNAVIYFWMSPETCLALRGFVRS